MAETILNISADESLLNTRSVILQQEGFEVVSAMDMQQVVLACQTHKFDAVILGHSISPREKRHIIETVRGVCQAGTPIIALYRNSGEEADCAGADYAVSSLDGPTPLIFLIRAIFHKRSSPVPLN